MKIKPSMICGGYPNEGKGSCAGDSGGPFVCNDKGKAVAVGVISFGIGCGEAYPDGHTRNTYALNWIKTNMVTTNIEKRIIAIFNIKILFNRVHVPRFIKHP